MRFLREGDKGVFLQCQYTKCDKHLSHLWFFKMRSLIYPYNGTTEDGCLSVYFSFSSVDVRL